MHAFGHVQFAFFFLSLQGSKLKRVDVMRMSKYSGQSMHSSYTVKPQCSHTDGSFTVDDSNSCLST